MNHYCHRLLLYVTAIFSLCIFLSPLRAKAYDNTMFVVNATDTTLTIDWSQAAKDEKDETIANGATSFSYEYFKLSYGENPCDMNYVRNDAPKTDIPTSQTQYTIKNLKPGTDYFISVSWKSKYSGPNYGGNGWHNFQLNNAYTTKTEDKTAKLLGTTGTTASVDFRELLREVEINSLAEGKSPSSFDVTVGYADQGSGKDAAMKKAKEIAGKKYYRLTTNQGSYTMRGLTPGHSYTFVAAVRFSYSEKNGQSYKYKNDFRYFTLSDIKTKSTDDSQIYPNVPAKTTLDKRKDPVVGNKYLSNITSFGDSVAFVTKSGKDSITVDWSDQKDASMVIRAGQGESKICLVCVEEAQYDPYKDREDNGPNKNFGPNAREAVKRIDSKNKITVDPSQKSYTFTGLKPATRYLVMMKCSYKKTNSRCDLIYPFKTGIMTEGGLTDSQVRTQVEKNLVKAYMYDGTVTRDGSEAYLDWSGALAGFYGQTAFNNHYAQLTQSGTYGQGAKIGYAELPKNYSANDVKASYTKALAMAGNSDYTALVVNYPYTNTRIYGLKADSKYVFAIKFDSIWYNYGNSSTYKDVIYIDETGTNFQKAIATKTTYDGHSVSGSTGNNSGKSGGSGSNGNNSGYNYSGNNNSDKNSQKEQSNEGAGNKQGSTNNGSAAPAIGTPGNTTGDPGKADKNWKLANKKKSNKAWIYYDKNKLSARALKKKAQTVTFRIENSKGKIKVKDLSADNGNTSIKIKGRNVTVKFKKGAPKGTYKFSVTVGAKGKIKKTTDTIKIKVK
ncbi:fibronectin type III domain-containing protein [Butyrivibrio sp. AE3004]|uniref:fibronectin type III domain-containing protein n=1 Tax=Butyrivibrio sp. AE3004 TaxID=1506994 RepID=UPI000493BF5C|nr:fibronectin type III domain-containing protein [Butyrivibrio sp. AE3004]